MNTSSVRFERETQATPRVVGCVCEASAIALYRRSGFVEEGRSRGDAMRDGQLADALHMARLADVPSFVQH